MPSLEEMVANRDERRIALAAQRLDTFWRQVDVLLDQEEAIQRRNECFEALDCFLESASEVADIRMEHQLKQQWWDERPLKDGILPARNICAIIEGDWILQFFLVRDPFKKWMHYIYMYALRRKDIPRVSPSFAKTAKEDWMNPSNYVIKNHHPEMIVEALKALCVEAVNQ